MVHSICLFFMGLSAIGMLTIQAIHCITFDYLWRPFLKLVSVASVSVAVYVLVPAPTDVDVCGGESLACSSNALDISVPERVFFN